MEDETRNIIIVISLAVSAVLMYVGFSDRFFKPRYKPTKSPPAPTDNKSFNTTPNDGSAASAMLWTADDDSGTSDGGGNGGGGD